MKISPHLYEEGQIMLVGCVQERLLTLAMSPSRIVANAAPHRFYQRHALIIRNCHVAHSVGVKTKLLQAGFKSEHSTLQALSRSMKRIN